MPDYLDVLAKEATKTIQEGYYEGPPDGEVVEASLKRAILNCQRTPVISEIKFASPSTGTLKETGNPSKIALEMEKGGAIGISVLTEPKHFQGKLEFIPHIRGQREIPILMKDIILHPTQIEAASNLGANAILLIQGLFQRGYCEKGVQEMIRYSHSRGLEVLLEAHTEEEFRSAYKTDADMIGVNNRDLRTLDVDLKVTKRILTQCSPGGKVVVSESGIHNPQHIHLLKEWGVQAFLVGTSVMKSGNMAAKVKELVDTV